LFGQHANDLVTMALTLRSSMKPLGLVTERKVLLNRFALILEDNTMSIIRMLIFALALFSTIATAADGVSYANTGAITYDGETSQVLQGLEVNDSHNEPAGHIDEIVEQDGARLAIIDLNDSAKRVAVPMRDLVWIENRMVVDVTKAELASMKDIASAESEQ